MRHSALHPRHPLPAFLLVGALAHAAPTAGVGAQTLEGRVLDRMNESPVGGAIVTLMSRDGATRAEALSDAKGRFTIVPPWAGEYFLHVSRYAYADLRSPLLALHSDGTAPVELMLVPTPIRLEGIEVSVEEQAADELRLFGVTQRELGARWIGRSRIEAIAVKPDIGSIIERASLPGTRVTRTGASVSVTDGQGLCIRLERARAGSAADSCALMILDGVPVRGGVALLLDPESIGGMAVLQPREAESFYGGLGGSGAVLLWSRRPR